MKVLFLFFSIQLCFSQENSKVFKDGELSVKQLITPHFNEMPLDRKLFVYYISEGIEAGRDIAWKQLSLNGLKIRKLLEKIWLKSDTLTSSEKKSLSKYYYQILLNHGNYNPHKNQKFVLEDFTEKQFVEMLQKLKLSSMISSELISEILDENFRKARSVTGSDVDPIFESNTNFYGKGMTASRLATLSEEERNHFLSTPVWNEKLQKVELELHKVGGRFSNELKVIYAQFERAKEFANEDEKRIISAHQKALLTGNPRDLLAAEALWVQYLPEDISFTIGFVETYDDPMEIRGTWEGFILKMNSDPATKRRSIAIRSAAKEFEALMPVDPAYKKMGDFSPPKSEGAFQTYAGGGDNETFFSGVNLPNNHELSDLYGSQSFTAYNKILDISPNPAAEFSDDELNLMYKKKFHSVMKKYGKTLPFAIEVEFHEILGHGSGTDLPGVNSPAFLGSFYSAFEEGRAELAAIFHITNYKFLIEKGIFPDTYSEKEALEFAQNSIALFFTKHIHSFSQLTGKTEIKQAHQLGRQVILNHLLESKALSVTLNQQGIPQVDFKSIEEVHRSLGHLWEKIQEIKSTGNQSAAEEMLKTFGRIKKDQLKWIAAAEKAKTLLKIPKHTIYLNPQFKLLKDSSGKVQDVQIQYFNESNDLDFLFQNEREKRIKSVLRAKDCRSMLKDLL